MELKNEPRTDQLRMSGFLEKKGKMKLMSPWRKYWFVLEERLLLYYRSEIEYKNLSPCRGSLNMGLVTSVRPGSSTGPCIIQIVTRTQTVQLRAKNRATQEEWLHALLRSKALPFASQIARPPTFKPGFIGCTKSLESLSFDLMLKRIGFEKECTLPRHLNSGSKNHISGSYYGGSLDTAIWSKKCRPFPSPSPNLPKGKMLEKILGFSKENDFHGFVDCPKKTSFRHLTSDNEIKFLGKHLEEEEEGGGGGDCKNMSSERKCRVHDENRNHHSQVKEPCYEFIDKKKIKIHKTFSDPELNENKTFHYPETVKSEKKDGSAFDRIRSALGKTSKDKSLKMNGSADVKARATRKRRKSFLEKVFKRKGDEIYEYDSDITDPLYETINIKPENRRPLSPIVYNEEDKGAVEKVNAKGDNREERVKDFANETRDNSSDSIPKKTLAGSKILLPADAMSELKLNLKSQRHRENSDFSRSDSDEEVSNTLQAKVTESDKIDNAVPLLPPRRVSRPVSPWHDVPTNNAPISDNPKSFFVHQAVVKFKDHAFAPEIERPKMDDSSLNEDDCQEDSLKPQEDFLKEIKAMSAPSQSKNDDLSLLLTQLTKITVAPLAEPEVDDSCSSESEKHWGKTQHVDPDYDVPRPHKPLNILINPGSEIISSMQFMGRREDNSDASSSFQSMEPDSLETAEKKFIQT